MHRLDPRAIGKLPGADRDAGPPHDDSALVSAMLLKLIQQSRLADTGLTRDDREARLLPIRVVQHAVQFEELFRTPYERDGHAAKYGGWCRWQAKRP
jgi:hypothetical protein